jgi:protein TonB
MNPQAVGIVVLLHGAALAALLMAKGDMVGRIIRTPIQVKFIPEKPVPPEKPKPLPPQKAPPPRSHIDEPRPLIQTRPLGPVISQPPLKWTPPPGPIVGNTINPPSPPPPPPPPTRTFEPARAHANLSAYVSNADYPDAALRNEEQGTTRFRLQVGPDGKVTDCTVTGSSGSSALDAATCRLMKVRARFSPARDSNGNPATDSVASAIRWVLPAG